MNIYISNQSFQYESKRFTLNQAGITVHIEGNYFERHLYRVHAIFTHIYLHHKKINKNKNDLINLIISNSLSMMCFVCKLLLAFSNMFFFLFHTRLKVYIYQPYFLHGLSMNKFVYHKLLIVLMITNIGMSLRITKNR